MSTRNLWDKGPVPVSHRDGIRIRKNRGTVRCLQQCSRHRAVPRFYWSGICFFGRRWDKEFVPMSHARVLFSRRSVYQTEKSRNFLKVRVGQGTCPRVPSGEFFPGGLQAVDDGKMLRTCRFAGSALDAFVRGLAILKDHVHIPVLFRICVVKGYIVPG